MRILILSFYFPPYNFIGAIRTGKIAKYLATFGHEVRVISARDHHTRDTSMPLEIPRENVVYTRWLNPRWLSWRIAGHRRSVIDRGKTGSSAPGPLALRYQALAAIRSVVAFPDWQIGWLPFALRAASKIVSAWCPDVIYATSGPPTALLAASLLSQRISVPWIADLRDLWVDHQEYRHPWWRKRLEEKLERTVLTSARGLVTVSQPLADTLESKYAKPTAVVLNGFDPADYPSSAERSGREELRLVYTGMVYPWYQSPAPLFEAMRRLGPEARKVRVAFYGSPPDHVRELADQHGVGDMVEIHGRVAHHEALRVQSETDVLLHLLWNDPKQPGVYNSKIYEYLGAHRPILAVGYSGNVTARLIGERGAGVVLDDPARIAEQLGAWLRQKEEMGEVPGLDEGVATGFSREHQTRLLEKFIIGLLGIESKQGDWP